MTVFCILSQLFWCCGFVGTLDSSLDVV